MKVLFTSSNSPLSRLIRKITGEQVSHCALRVYDCVIHSNLLGVHMEPFESFNSSIIESVELPDNLEKVINLLAKYDGNFYDFGALFYLGLRSLFPFLPKANLWQTTGMFLCTEWITEVVDGKENSMITPHQLYLKLKGEQ